jgi:uncharacterized membrane protein YfcA
MNDPRNIWQNQPNKEPFKMSADQLRRKAQQRQQRARFEAIFSILLGIFLFLFFARACATAHELLPRMGLGLLSLWCLYFAYQAYKWIWPRPQGPDGALETTLQSYRSELEKRRDYNRHVWRKAGLTFCFLGMAMVVAPVLIKSLDDPRLLFSVAPLFVLLAIWLAVFFPIRKRKLQKLQQEIEDLRTVEGYKGS